MTATAPVVTETKTPEKKKCVACDSEILRGADTCPVCTSKQKPTFCVNCKKRLPLDAKICSICKSYQRWWRFLSEFTTALPAVALAAMISGVWTAAAYLYDRNSHTNFKFVSANANVVNLTAWNTGQKPSALLGGRLHFGGSPIIDDVALYLPEVDVREAKTVIQKGELAKIALTVPPFPELHNGDKTYTKDEAQRMLPTRQVTLYLNVSESTGQTASPQDTFAASRIQTFITGRVYK